MFDRFHCKSAEIDEFGIDQSALDAQVSFGTHCFSIYAPMKQRERMMSTGRSCEDDWSTSMRF